MTALHNDFADSHTAWDNVVQLIVRIYSEAGYISDKHLEKRSAEILDLLSHPATKTFTACIDDILVGSISIIEDNKDGIPLDQIFKDKTEVIRDKGNSFAEVGQFAVDKQLIAKLQKKYGKLGLDKEVSLSLMKYAFHYGMRAKINIICITINPKHRTFYEYLGFTPIGDVRSYSSVEEAPAVFMTIDLDKLQSHDREDLNMLLAEIFNHPPEERVLKQALSSLPQLLPV